MRDDNELGKDSTCSGTLVAETIFLAEKALLQPVVQHFEELGLNRFDAEFVFNPRHPYNQECGAGPTAARGKAFASKTL
ncbi:hypothetical protein [Silvibacterium acidisoli]|uniref:hypothetical protein n=1 Tax=Acidobacteriaceae bacterium ZG23-2 TaxID=2883246 RepID=UPI00406CDE62